GPGQGRIAGKVVLVAGREGRQRQQGERCGQQHRSGSAWFRHSAVLPPAPRAVEEGDEPCRDFPTRAMAIGYRAAMPTSLDDWFTHEILVHEAALQHFLARRWPHRDEVADLRQE